MWNVDVSILKTSHNSLFHRILKGHVSVSAIFYELLGNYRFKPLWVIATGVKMQNRFGVHCAKFEEH